MKENAPFNWGILIWSFLLSIGIGAHTILVCLVVRDYLVPFAATGANMSLIAIYFGLSTACSFFELVRRQARNLPFMTISSLSIAFGVLCAVVANGNIHFFLLLEGHTNLLSASFLTAVANFALWTLVLAVSRKRFRKEPSQC
jgi:hypothetical protein